MLCLGRLLLFPAVSAVSLYPVIYCGRTLSPYSLLSSIKAYPTGGSHPPGWLKWSKSSPFNWFAATAHTSNSLYISLICVIVKRVRSKHA